MNKIESAKWHLQKVLDADFNYYRVWEKQSPPRGYVNGNIPVDSLVCIVEGFRESLEIIPKLVEALETAIKQMSFLACCCRCGESLNSEDEKMLLTAASQAYDALALAREEKP